MGIPYFEASLRRFRIRVRLRWQLPHTISHTATSACNRFKLTPLRANRGTFSDFGPT
jgi:hypothetical protein